MAAGRLPVQLATRVLGVSESGYYEWRDRAPSARAVRHAWLTEQIQAVHLASRGTYGSRRVHAKYRNLAEPGPERQNGRVYSADFFEDRWRRYPHQSLSGGPLDGGGGSGHLGRSSPGRGVSRADQADRCARGGTPGAGPRGRVA